MGYTAVYKKYIDDKTKISAKQMAKGKFYLIKEYRYVDGDVGNFNESTAPIVFVLYTSIAKDIIHCVKVSDINPQTVKKLFGKLYDENDRRIALAGGPQKIYEGVLKKMPSITNDTYRTYKISGIKKVIKIDIDEEKIIPKATVIRMNRADKIKEKLEKKKINNNNK